MFTKIIDWFRKRKIIELALERGCDVDGDLITYKGVTYLIRIYTGEVKRVEQYTFIYCPKCNNEMVSNGHAIEDNDGIIKYKCSKCGNISFWDFAHFPVPYLRTCADCRHFLTDKYGRGYCEKDCFPDTQKAFEPKGLGE